MGKESILPYGFCSAPIDYRKSANSRRNAKRSRIEILPPVSPPISPPLVETSSFNDILFPSAEDQIYSFVSSDTENDNNNSLETLEVIDNAYKYTKYKKIKDVVLPEKKNDLSDFIQNEVK